ncbi:MAG TPA: LysM peptidoglycan-binding domain-containing protein [Anaerolineales bacterium]|nr:LysM peptidoglycan-binding domain-containing protein [Anaerolineales bacterium]
MNARKFTQFIIVAILLFASFASVGGASAWSQCPAYITVQWGDTLSGIAKKCDTTVDAIRAANPSLGWWLYTGQVIYIPGGYTPNSPQTYNTYTVHWGDTLGKIAARSGTTISNLLAVNPQIYNPSLIYAGQVINLPSGVSVPPPPTKTSPTPSPSSDSFKIVKITYKGGLFIRTAPGGKIVSSAVLNTYWYYNTSNIRKLDDGSIWVEVKLGEQINGSWRGWMLVKDRLGTYFTSPKIDK